MTSLRTELNWGMLEKAAAELPDSLSGGGAEGASTPKPPPLLERPGATAAAGAGAVGLGSILQRLGETHKYNVTNPGSWTQTFESSPSGKAELTGGYYHGRRGVTTKSPYRPNSGMPNGLFGREWHRAHRLDRLRSALSVEPRYSKVLGRTPAIHHRSPRRGVYEAPRTPGTPLRHRAPGRLSRLPGALKGVGGGLGLLSLYNLMRGSESD